MPDTARRTLDQDQERPQISVQGSTRAIAWLHGFVSACQCHQTLRHGQRIGIAGARCADMPEQAFRTLSRMSLPSVTEDSGLWLAFS